MNKLASLIDQSSADTLRSLLFNKEVDLDEWFTSSFERIKNFSNKIEMGGFRYVHHDFQIGLQVGNDKIWFNGIRPNFGRIAKLLWVYSETRFHRNLRSINLEHSTWMKLEQVIVNGANRNKDYRDEIKRIVNEINNYRNSPAANQFKADHAISKLKEEMKAFIIVNKSHMKDLPIYFKQAYDELLIEQVIES